MPARLIRQTLLFDADDTLWENNIYFEQAIASFLAEFDHTPHSKQEIRQHLDRCEHENIRRIGYGLRSFEASLVQCFTELSQMPMTAEVRGRFTEFAHSIASHEMELLPGVAETLPRLAKRHRLLLVTKGVEEEQIDKLHRSGLAPHFEAAEVLEEKSAEHYLALVERHSLQPQTTWMIGNSPKSDIHASLSAGLNAVHIPHPITWVLEQCDVCAPREGRQMLQMHDFAGLAEYF